MPLVGVWAGTMAFLNGLVLVLAQTTDSPVDPYLPLVNLGGFGFLLVFVLTGRLVSKTQYEQALKDRDRDHGELVALRQKLDDVVIPGFIRMTDLYQREIERERLVYDEPPQEPRPPRRRS